jgi:hypothetical protein
MALKVKGSSRGVEHPITEDMALQGDTRHELHYKPLPRQEHPYKAHQNSHNFGSGNPGDEARDDTGQGQTDGCC